MWFALVFLLSISPRLIMFIMFIVSQYLEKAYSEYYSIWPILGFLFMPWTTLWCAYVFTNGGDFSIWRIIMLILCVLSDSRGDSNSTSGSNE